MKRSQLEDLMINCGIKSSEAAAIYAAVYDIAHNGATVSIGQHRTIHGAEFRTLTIQTKITDCHLQG